MAVSHPVAADSSPAGLSGEISLDSELKDVVASTVRGVRNGSGSHPEPVSNFCALSAISPFFSCPLSGGGFAPCLSHRL